MIGRRLIGACAPLGRTTLGTTITDSPDLRASVARLKCSPNYGRVTGQVCCEGLDPGEPLLDGNPPCGPGYGPVPADVENVFAILRDDGTALIVGGPPPRPLSEPFRLPGDIREKPAEKAARVAAEKAARVAAEKAARSKTPGPGEAAPPPAAEGGFGRYAGAILIAAGAIAAGLILTGRRESAAAPAAPPPSPVAPAAPPAPAAA